MHSFKFSTLIAAVIFVILAFSGNADAIGLGSVASTLSNVKKIYDYVKSMSPINRELVNKVEKDWPYQKYMREVQFNPKGYDHIYIFTIPKKGAFDGDQAAFADDVYDEIRESGARGYNFQRVMDVLKVKSEKFNWYISSHTIQSPGKAVWKGNGNTQWQCWESNKWNYITMGPIPDYLIDLNILQQWHNQNKAQQGSIRAC